MDQGTIQILFALLRSGLCGAKEALAQTVAPEQLQEIMKLAKRHNLAHLVALGADRNAETTKKIMLTTAYRQEQQKTVQDQVCEQLEKAQIPFLPLKGSVIRSLYPEPWMRTSCDIDILVHRQDLDRAGQCLCQTLQFTENGRGTHDISYLAPNGVYVELHYDLVEEGRANQAILILQDVWSHSTVSPGSEYWYEMSDPYFYFYHIAHMVKHFETGGCGVRPFMDLWFLDQVSNECYVNRNALLDQGNLLQFANAARKLSRVWFGGEEHDALSAKMEDFVLRGGAFGTTGNRVSLQQKRRGGRLGYFFSRVFLPYSKLKRYFPVLEKHWYLAPVMQVRRWLWLLKPDMAKRAKHELSANAHVADQKAVQMQEFLDQLGL